MAFQTSIAQWLKSSGGCPINLQLLNQNGNTAIVVPASGSFWPGLPRAGYIRIKSSTVGTNCQSKVGIITMTDLSGTNIANIYTGDRHYSANGQYIDQAFFFCYDWGIANLALNVWTFNSNASTYDIEVVGME
jgi:hypothetical protein